MRLLPALLLSLPAWCADNTPVVDWVRANAIRLTTPEAGHGFDDMQPLKKIIRTCWLTKQRKRRKQVRFLQNNILASGTVGRKSGEEVPGGGKIYAGFIWRI